MLVNSYQESIWHVYEYDEIDSTNEEIKEKKKTKDSFLEESLREKRKDGRSWRMLGKIFLQEGKREEIY